MHGLVFWVRLLARRLCSRRPEGVGVVFRLVLGLGQTVGKPRHHSSLLLTINKYHLALQSYSQIPSGVKNKQPLVSQNKCMWRTPIALLMFFARPSFCFISSHTKSGFTKHMSRKSTVDIVHTFSGLGLDRSRVESELKEPTAFHSALKTDGASKCLIRG